MTPMSNESLHAHTVCKLECILRLGSPYDIFVRIRAIAKGCFAYLSSFGIWGSERVQTIWTTYSCPSISQQAPPSDTRNVPIPLPVIEASINLTPRPLIRVPTIRDFTLLLLPLGKTVSEPRQGCDRVI